MICHYAVAATSLRDLTSGHAPNAVAPASFIAAKPTGQMDARSIRGKPRRSLHLRSMQSIRLLDGHLGNLTTSDPGLGMTKSELTGHIASQNPHLYQRDIENVVNAIIDEIVKALGRGDRVE